MKAKKLTKYPAAQPFKAQLKEVHLVPEPLQGPMVRTQIYLSKAEHDFVAAEAKRRDAPMAAVIRSFIDEKMEVPEDAWTNNPMLRPFPTDPDWKGHEDGAINHDHYLYGATKRYIKVKGKWVDAPPLPDDYHENPASANAYDKLVRKMDESK